MINIKGKVVLIIISIFLLNCHKSIKKIDKNELNSFLEVNIKDTLNLKTEFGYFNFNSILKDSLKITEKDDRVLFIYLNVFDKNKIILDINKVECDTFYNQTKNFKDTISTMFYVNPKKKGNKIIAGFVEEMLFLNSYKYKDSTRIRQIINKYYFKKDVYIK